MLLDSNTLLWLLYVPERLGPETVKAIQRADRVFLSTASLWELAIKHAAGKLAFSPKEIAQESAEANIERMDIVDHHLIKYADIDLPQKDPLDRLLVTQALCEGVPLVTADRNLLASKYDTLDSSK